MNFRSYNYWSSEAEKSLSERLGLCWDQSMQDWDLINSNPDHIDHFLKVYNQLSDSNEKFVLMQLIIASFDDIQDMKSFDDASWNKCAIILEKQSFLHIQTIFCWCTEGNTIPYFISPFMDTIYEKVKTNF